MAIELPTPVVDFLQVIGINFPQVNEDSVRDFASHVREFAAGVDSAHQAATSTVDAMSSAYSGSSYEQLVQTWADMSGSHMTDLVDGCNVVATALDAAADVIVAMKVEAIAELVVLAATFVADQAAAVVTFGLSEAALPLIEEAGTKICEVLEQQLLQHIIGAVITAAIEPLESIVEKAISGLKFSTGGAGMAPGESFGMIPEQLLAHGTEMQAHADTVAGHASTLSANLSGLSFA
jgi:uncharacterized protein YukE